MPKSPNLSAIRAKAGRAGAAARWAGVKRQPTTQIRVFVSDAARIKAMPGTSAEVVKRLLTAAAGNAILSPV